MLKTAYPSARETSFANQQRELAGNIAAELGSLALALTNACHDTKEAAGSRKVLALLPWPPQEDSSLFSFEKC